MSREYFDPADGDALILVDSNDVEVGFESKQKCHNGAGLLHRAFSVFLFNFKGELLLQKRASVKRLWPNFWSNSCCSHPRKGEETDAAAVRRTQEELGITGVSIDWVYKFEYQAHFEDAGTEHELCHVFVGRSDAEVVVDPAEISETKWIKPDALDRDIASRPEIYSPWFKMEWAELREHYKDAIKELI